MCIAGGAFHAALRGYKDASEQVARRRYTDALASLIDTFLERHERCLAAAAGAAAFDTVTVVPSSSPARDDLQPALRELAGRLCEATRERHLRLLTATAVALGRRGFDARRYVPANEAGGRQVLLLEDTWVTGARALSAAAALRAAGALSVAVLTIGRFVTADHDDNVHRLLTLPEWSADRCAVCS